MLNILIVRKFNERKVKMEAYQTRVVKEQKLLQEKIEDLAAFMDGDTFQVITKDEQSLLNAQLNIMLAYRDILNMRIAKFA